MVHAKLLMTIVFSIKQLFIFVVLLLVLLGFIPCFIRFYSLFY